MELILNGQNSWFYSIEYFEWIVTLVVFMRQNESEFIQNLNVIRISSINWIKYGNWKQDRNYIEG